MATSTIKPINRIQRVDTNATDMDELTAFSGVIYNTSKITANRPKETGYWLVIPLGWAQIAICGNTSSNDAVYIRQYTNANGWANPWKKIALTSLS